MIDRSECEFGRKPIHAEHRRASTVVTACLAIDAMEGDASRTVGWPRLIFIRDLRKRLPASVGNAENPVDSIVMDAHGHQVPDNLDEALPEGLTQNYQSTQL